MKCADVQRTCLENDGSALPTPVLEHLIGCVECRKAYERAQIVTKLIGLKRHETPAPGFEARMAARVRAQIEAEKPAAFGGLRVEWLTGSLRGWHVATAAAAALLLAAAGTFLALPQKPVEPTFAAQPAPASPAMALPASSVQSPLPMPDNPAWQKPILVFDDRGPLRRPLDARATDLNYGNSETTSVPAEFTIPSRPQE
jgi:hypothetical protein